MNLQLGQNLPPMKQATITRDQLALYAQASGDRNPIHLDEKFAKDAGFPSVIAHGMLSMAFMGDYIVHCLPQFQLAKLKARFKRIIFPGDTVTCSGKVKVLTPDTATITLSVTNQKGEETTGGEALLSRNP